MDSKRENGSVSPGFQTSVPAMRAAQIIIESAKSEGVIKDGGLIVDPALAEMEKALFAGIFKVLARRGDSQLSAEEFSSIFHFVFARAAEAACACWSGRPFETGTEGIFDGNIPYYVDESLQSFVRASTFPVKCAQNCWDLLPEVGGSDPLLALCEALKWCFRFGCHASLEILERTRA